LGHQVRLHRLAFQRLGCHSRIEQKSAHDDKSSGRLACL
jgi:hypothetical protein